MKQFGRIYKLAMIVATAILVGAAAILTKCPVYRIIPLYVSLFVMFLQMKAYRVSFLLGGLNAAYYSVVHYFVGLYGLALYSLLVACPIQIVTYIRWKKRAYKHSTLLKKLSWKQRIFSGSIFAVIWCLLYGVLSLFGSGYLILDNSASVIGAAANIASLLYLIEFPYIQCVSLFINILLYINMVPSDPMQWTFLIYTVYALICAIISAVYMQRLYNHQAEDKEIKEA